MGIFLAVALVTAVLFIVSVGIRAFVAVIGGAQPESDGLRRLSEAGQAKLATARIDREYRDLLVH